MGRMILCTGVRAKTPYCFDISETKVYSMEELVFYLYQNLYAVQEEALDESLAVWIGSELKLPGIEKAFLKLLKEKAPIKDKVLLLFRSCHYYEEEEIAEAERTLEKIAQLPPFGRLKLRAENSLRYHNYVRAAYLYENLLKRSEAAKLAPEEYGEILHNQALAHIYTMSCAEAAEEFREAYVRNQREESLVQYLYALLISNQQEKFEQAVEDFHVTDEQKEKLRQQVEMTFEQAAKTEDARQLEQAERMWKNGKAEEYYQTVQKMLDRWKRECRKYLQ